MYYAIKLATHPSTKFDPTCSSVRRSCWSLQVWQSIRFKACSLNFPPCVGHTFAYDNAFGGVGAEAVCGDALVLAGVGRHRVHDLDGDDAVRVRDRVLVRLKLLPALEPFDLQGEIWKLDLGPKRSCLRLGDTDNPDYMLNSAQLPAKRSLLCEELSL